MTTSIVNGRSTKGAGSLFHERGLSSWSPLAVGAARSRDLPLAIVQNDRRVHGIARMLPILARDSREQQTTAYESDVPAVTRLIVIGIVRFAQLMLLRRPRRGRSHQPLRRSGGLHPLLRSLESAVPRKPSITSCRRNLRAAPARCSRPARIADDWTSTTSDGSKPGFNCSGKYPRGLQMTRVGPIL